MYLTVRITLFSIFWLLSLGQSTAADYSSLFEITAPQQVFEPSSYAEIQALVKKASLEGKKVCVLGAGKSQGGQTASHLSDAYRFNMHKLKKLVALDTQKQEVTVQAGMTWERLQKYLAPHKLSIQAMQSYNDFSIGGSLSVNAHGQDPHEGHMIHTVQSFKLITPQGELITVSRTEHPDLFGRVIGGYGLFGIIVEATLKLTSDCLITQNAVTINSEDLADFVLNKVKNNPHVTFFSARFSVGYPDLFKKAIVMTYEQNDADEADNFELEPTTIKTPILRTFIHMTRKANFLKRFRFHLEKYFVKKPSVTSRNNFLNYSIAGLPQDTATTRYILQEYFIPYASLTEFIKSLGDLITAHDINILNMTARHLKPDTETMLTFTPQETCALVLYINTDRTPQAYTKVVDWTRQVIDKALEVNGTFYLPYQQLATQEQLEKAYPAFKQFVADKKAFDPQELLSNQLYEQYAK